LRDQKERKNMFRYHTYYENGNSAGIFKSLRSACRAIDNSVNDRRYLDDQLEVCYIQKVNDEWIPSIQWERIPEFNQKDRKLLRRFKRAMRDIQKE
jgi:hypothetical protein